MAAELSHGVLLSQWCGALFDRWVQLGLTDVVLCPGSRNAALIEEAQRREGLRCHSVVDERSAGFFALGLSRVTERPTVVCCTSGSALGHLLPAVMEGYHADVPLLVLSADRPLDLQDCGAPQTLKQPGALSPFAPCDHPWLEPSAETESFQRWLDVVDEAWRAAVTRAQPVHLNVPLAKPLEPGFPSRPEEVEFQGRVASWVASRQKPSLPGVSRLNLPERIDLVSLGPASASAQDAARRLATRVGAPLVCEYPLGEGAVLPGSVAAWLDAREGPTHWLHVGHPQVQSKWDFLLRRPDVQRWVLSGMLARDPLRRASVESGHPLDRQLAAALEATAEQRGAVPWDAHLNSQSMVQGALSQVASRGARTWPEPIALERLLREASERLGQILLGNSLSLRLIGRLAPLLPSGPRYRFMRGVNGIDGGIAHACGAATAMPEPTLAVLGDVAALHDAGSLALCRRLTSPLILALVDNQGGRIFDALPVAADWDERPGLKDCLRTAPLVDWSHLCAAYGVAYERVDCSVDLEAALERALCHDGTSLLHLVVDTEPTLPFFRLIAESEPAGWGDGL